MALDVLPAVMGKSQSSFFDLDYLAMREQACRRGFLLGSTR